MLRSYHFLGSLSFALILIATTALFVIAGTFIESSTQSHQYASSFTYSNPIFGLLLWGFFVNILFSATRRWPFQVRHVPFLITHLGLLMILGGVIIKHWFGVQGSMSIIEGSGSHEILNSSSYALQVEKRGDEAQLFPLKSSLGGFDGHIGDADGLQLRLAGFHPHSSERMASWIKNGHLVISGLSPMPRHVVDNSKDIPLSGKVRFAEDSPPWLIYALQTNTPITTFEKLYKKNAHIVFTNRLSQTKLTSIGLDKDTSLVEGYGSVTAQLAMGFSTEQGFNKPHLILTNSSDNKRPLAIQIPLEGPEALFNINLSTPFLGNFPYAIDIESQSFIAFLEDENHDIQIFASDKHGRIWWQPFHNSKLETLLSYDDGYMGYAVQAKMPLTDQSTSRQKREDTLLQQVESQLRQAMKNGIELSPPLKLWQETCLATQTDFATSIMEFLKHWDATHSWIYPKNIPLPQELAVLVEKMDWNLLPIKEQQACQWATILFHQIEPELRQGKDLLTLLRHQRWPLLTALEEGHQKPLPPDEVNDVLTLLTQQIFAAAESQANEESVTLHLKPEEKASLYSAYLRAYGIHLSTITPQPADEVNEEAPIVFETSIFPVYQPLEPTSKPEDHHPLIALNARKGGQVQKVYLRYDPQASGLKWPILNGEYLVRFQPNFTALPYRVRLRNARQINYPNSNQPYSFESDLIITDKRTGKAIEKTISMNNVHETWDGYRFYLASMHPSTEDSIKRVQIVVNHDPAKYWLTYPGALILTLGILLLFTLRPYKKS